MSLAKDDQNIFQYMVLPNSVKSKSENNNRVQVHGAKQKTNQIKIIIPWGPKNILPPKKNS